MGRRRALRIVAIACAALVVLILYVTLTPEPVDKPYAGLVNQIVVAVRRVPGFGWFDYLWLERLSNLAMFLPLGVLLELLLGVRRWWLVLVIGAVFSTALELAQYLWLPDRFATVDDVIFNTLGTGVGAALSALVTVLGRRMRRTSPERRRARG